MGRSQRHMVFVQGTDAAGKGLAQKQPAPVYIKQYADSVPFAVPVGPSGGPLKGSTTAGYPPTLIPPPGPALLETEDETREAMTNWEQPGQFNNCGNPTYDSLPAPGDSGGTPSPGPAPTIAALDPNTAEVGGADVMMKVLGGGFQLGTVIMFNESAEVTNVNSETECETIVKPSTASGAIEVEVYVRNPDGQESNRFAFTFTEAEPEAENAAMQRTLPLGPFDIVRIEDVGDTLRVFLGQTTLVRSGDTVVIEATGNTSVNGEYRVGSVATTANATAFVIDNAIELAAPIEGRGRVTVTS